MKLFALSGLLIGINCTAMAVFVYWKSPNNRVNKFWAFFCFVVSVWGFGGFASGSTENPGTALLNWRLAYVGVIFIPTVFYHYVLMYTGLKRPRTLFLAYFSSFIFTLALSTPLMIPNVTWMFNEFYCIYPPGVLFPYFMVYYVVIVIVAHVHLWNFLEKTTEREKRLQASWFLLATSLAFIGGGLSTLPVFGVRIYIYSNFLVAIYPLIMGYAIFKHKLMDIEIVIKKTIYYSVLTVSISLIYLMLVFICYSTFLAGQKPSPLLNFLGILFIAGTFKPLEMLFQRIIERRLFKGSITEISDKNARLESELERSERLKSVGILAAGMAHEIKNPLTSIRTFAEYLPKKYQDEEFREKFSKILMDETDRISTIVRDLLLFSKPSEPVMASCDIAKILMSIMDLMRADLLKRGIELELNISDKLPKCLADESQLKQAFLNIIVNGVEAMREGAQPKRLGVEARFEDKKIIISVSDSGAGIPADKIGHIFDPFYTSKDGGTGLGLSVTHSIIQKHHGNIRCESVWGVGTKFMIVLPVK